MSGLLSDVLPWIYSNSDLLKKKVGGLLSDPSAYISQSAGVLADASRDQQSLHDSAFSDKSNPFKITDKAAFNKLAETTMNGVLGFAPVGMIAKTTGATSNLADAQEFANLISRSGKEFVPNIIQDKGGSVYVTVQKLPLTKSGEVAKNRRPANVDFKARFADHPQYWGASISSDPITQNTTRDAYEMFANKFLGAPPMQKPPVKAYFDPRDGIGRVVETRLSGKKPSVSGKSIVDDWIVEERKFSINPNIE